MSDQDTPDNMAATVVREWREANEWPGLVWSAQILSDEPKWRAAWSDLEARVTDALRAHEQAVRAEERQRAAKIAETAPLAGWLIDQRIRNQIGFAIRRDDTAAQEK